MKRLLLGMGFAVLLFAGPALFACERCAVPGWDAKTHSTAPWARCLFDCAGTLNLCQTTEDSKYCNDINSEAAACPDCDGGGGGVGGGGGTGGGGSCISTSSYCPPNCMSCGGGGGNLY
ncbi:MAG TPA: hypothetical protein VII75_08080 [Thermoanaerobaculia bacterium]